MPANPWSPSQYEKFERERAQPFEVLASLVRPVPGGRIVDLGCGPGTRTVELSTRLRAAEVVGIDHSPEMLSRATSRQAPGVRFERGDIDAFTDADAWDVVFSNAALHWIDDHDGLFSRLVAALRSQGQLAVQMPMNFDHPSSSIAAELATEAEYASELAGRVRGAHVDAPEVYAERLYALGIEDIDVHVRVFLHELEGAEDVLEWTRGSTLTWYRRQLGDALFAAFEAEYTRRVLDALPKAKPYLFTFNRLFIYGRRP